FMAAFPKYGLTNDGREFFLGMLYPSYNTIASSYTSSDFNVVALISSYYENDIVISFFDAAGKESNLTPHHILAGTFLKAPLNVQLMQMDTTSDAPAYKSCHIVSKYPISVYYLSAGACSGGSYLALPVLGLGTNYVAASYNDNPGNGAIYGFGFYPSTFDYAGGEFIVIGTEAQTKVKITPATTTRAGHPGANTGTPQPYSIQLNRGECYLVRSNGRNSDNDMSGSLIEASKPVAVISGHEDASLGGANPYNIDGRDFMIEQMVPVEYWDSTGYISVPFAEPIPPGTEGQGDTYRIYTFDSTAVQAHLDVQGISGGYDFLTKRFAAPEKIDVTAPAQASSKNGKKISLMQYDERSQTAYPPWPCPSMMTVVPISRWKSNFFFSVFGNKNPLIKSYNYINIITSNLDDITYSIDGGPSLPLSGLSRSGTLLNVLAHSPSLNAYQYKFSSTFPDNAYFLSSSTPFSVSYYGFVDLVIRPSDLGNPNEPNFYQEYAAPAGMQLNTGVIPSFTIDTTSTCSGWHICIRDTGKNDPGIKAVTLIDDPDAVYWQQPGAKFSNVSFDTLSADYTDGELHPHFHSAQKYCFDVNFLSPLAAASAPLAIVDNLGNAAILWLKRSASTIALSTNPPASGRADSIVFPVKKIGEQICTTFVFKNTAAIGGTALNLTSASLTNADSSYVIQSVTPSLPHALAPKDSLTLQVCYTPADSSRHRDSLVMKTDCFSLAISLDAHGTTGLINAADQDFGQVTVGSILCKNVLIRNVGSAAFTLTKQFLLSDTVNFSVDSTRLPIQIKEGTGINISVCFHPVTEGSYTAGIDWGTDLEPSFAHSVKSHTLLTGTATPKEGVTSSSTPIAFSIHPNPANGSSVFVSFTEATAAKSIDMFDVLGREVYRQNVFPGTSQIEIPIRTLPEGVYYVQFNSATGSATEKFIKVK
ncbi:MAG: T9SS type A sorting domain-containing protein, partial [Candidatus Kapaibacterium sp.]